MALSETLSRSWNSSPRIASPWRVLCPNIATGAAGSTGDPSAWQRS